MATTFPTSIDALTNPTAGNSVATVSHSSQHINVNDAIEAIEAKVGADSSAVTTSHDYKLSAITSSAKAVSNTSGTLTSPTIVTDITIPNTGLHLLDTNATHDLIVAPGSNLTADRTLTVTTGDSDRTLDLGSSLTIPADPNADRILFWDDSAGATAYLEVGTGLSISGTTISNTVTGATVTTFLPFPVGSSAASTTATLSVNVNTTQIIGLVSIPYQIVVNNIVLEATTVNVAGTLDIALYSEDGQTRLINITTATISGTGNVSTATGGVTLSPGLYYMTINSNSTADIVIRGWSIADIVLMHTVSGQPMYAGTQTITAGTPATTLTPTALTATTAVFAMLRFET